MLSLHESEAAGPPQDVFTVSWFRAAFLSHPTEPPSRDAYNLVYAVLLLLLFIGLAGVPA